MIVTNGGRWRQGWMAGTAQGNGWSMADGSGDTVGAAAPPRRVARPCSLLRGQATAPTRMVCVSAGGFGGSGGPAAMGSGTMHPASRPGGRSYRQGVHGPEGELGGSGGPAAMGSGTMHPASRPGGRSYRQGVCPARRVNLVGAAAPPLWGLSLVITLCASSQARHAILLPTASRPLRSGEIHHG